MNGLPLVSQVQKTIQSVGETVVAVPNPHGDQKTVDVTETQKNMETAPSGVQSSLSRRGKNNPRRGEFQNTGGLYDCQHY